MNKFLVFVWLFLGSPVGAAAESNHLEPTKYIDSKNAALILQVNKIVAGAKSEIEKAVLIHDFVRDTVSFGWSASFYDQKASEVLESKIGYCNTKSTLFVAMLRAAGIPAKQRFVNISAKILEGILDPGTAYVDHSYTEVFLQGTWLKVDSYIVDAKLANSARRKLQQENRVLGYGVHRYGVSNWDGTSNAFSQFLDDGSFKNLSTRDFGVYEDIEAFYRSGNGVNELNFGLRLVLRFFVIGANNRAEALRNESLGS
jgi:transglutaminase-like putative cysteine protease